MQHDKIKSSKITGMVLVREVCWHMYTRMKGSVKPQMHLIFSNLLVYNHIFNHKWSYKFLKSWSAACPSQLDVLSTEERQRLRSEAYTVALLGIFSGVDWKPGPLHFIPQCVPRGGHGSCFLRQLPCTFPPRRKTSCVCRQQQDDSSPGTDSGTMWPSARLAN